MFIVLFFFEYRIVKVVIVNEIIIDVKYLEGILWKGVLLEFSKELGKYVFVVI